MKVFLLFSYENCFYIYASFFNVKLREYFISITRKKKRIQNPLKHLRWIFLLKKYFKVMQLFVVEYLKTFDNCIVWSTACNKNVKT